MRDYLMLVVVAGPFACMGLGYALDGSWQGILFGACSGMLLSGALRRVIMRGVDRQNEQAVPESDETTTKPKG